MTTPSLSKLSTVSDTSMTNPDWFTEYLAFALPQEGQCVLLDSQPFVMRKGILRAETVVSTAQDQTEKTFGFKWNQRQTFERDAALIRVREWLFERYGRVDAHGWFKDHGSHPLILDAGCGAGMSAIEYFGELLHQSRYLGVDISPAVDVAFARFRERGFHGAFLQASVSDLPLPRRSVDIIFSEGVLHHTDSTEQSFGKLSELLKPGGRFLFYVYRKKGPIREFTDDYIRDKLQHMRPEEAWKAVEPLTQLGKALGDLNVEVDVPGAIDLLHIPAGKINLQRLFYWHVCKAFYRPDLTLDEMNHINFDWYAPKNAHRHSAEEVRGWCVDHDLTIERERIEEAGITVIARKKVA